MTCSMACAQLIYQILIISTRHPPSPLSHPFLQTEYKVTTSKGFGRRRSDPTSMYSLIPNWERNIKKKKMQQEKPKGCENVWMKKK